LHLDESRERAARRVCKDVPRISRRQDNPHKAVMGSRESLRKSRETLGSDSEAGVLEGIEIVLQKISERPENERADAIKRANEVLVVQLNEDIKRLDLSQ
jgi:hypothetical protein